jgi:aryl-alcohol dehydrogenase-like predicted oxidoreductase
MKLALGTVQFGMAYGVANAAGQVPDSEVQAILQTAQAGGLDTLDTAIAYGQSEQILGACGVRGWQVVTKLPAVPNACGSVSQWVDSEVRGALTRLRLDRVDALLLHRPADVLGPHGRDLIRALRVVQESGMVVRLGVSVHEPDELRAIADAGMPIEWVQAPVSPLDTRWQRSGELERLADSGVRFHARSLFLQGLLLMSATDRPEKFSLWAPIWRQWHDWLQASQLNAAQACVRVAKGIRHVDRWVVGVQSAKQLKQLLGFAQEAAIEPPNWVELPSAALLNPAMWGQLKP